MAARQEEEMKFQSSIPLNLEQSREVKNKKKKKKKKHNQTLETNFIVHPNHPEKIAPIVAYFPSDYDPEGGGGEAIAPPEVGAYRKKDRPNRLQLVVSPHGCNVDFVGGSHSGEAAASQACNYALGVFDKDTQTLTITPVAANKILRLDPVVGGSSSNHKDHSKDLNEEDPVTATKAEQLRTLTHRYGTKRAKGQFKKVDNLHSANAEGMEDRVEGVQVNKEALDTTGGIVTHNIPPHDSTADTPEKAYPLDRIILEGEWNYLLDILELMRSGTEITPNSYPSFVCNRIHKLLEIKDEEEKEKLACIFSYITHLITFKDQQLAHHGTHAKNHGTHAKNHWIPAIINKKFLAMFADGRSDEKKNLLLSYVLVLTLIADGYRTDIADIAKDLKMSATSLRDHYLNLGCKLKRDSNKVLFCTLSVPLTFAKLKFQRRRR